MEKIKLSLNRRDPSKGVVLEFYAKNASVEDLELSETFRQLVYMQMPRETGWFHQSGCTPDNRPSNYHMFEFWNFDRSRDLVIAHSREIAAALTLDLELAV